MNAIQFIERYVVAELVKMGYEKSVAQQGANQAVDHYRRSSQASAKGKMYDDCLYIGKQWASKLQPRRKANR